MENQEETESAAWEARLRAAEAARRKRRDHATDQRERKRRVLDIVSSLTHEPRLRRPLTGRDWHHRRRAINALFVIAGRELWEDVSWAKPDLFIEWVDNLKHRGPRHAGA